MFVSRQASNKEKHLKLIFWHFKYHFEKLPTSTLNENYKQEPIKSLTVHHRL